MESAVPHLLSLATAVPPYRFEQQAVREVGARLFRDAFGECDYLLDVYQNAAIETRYSCVPLQWYLEEHGLAERNRLYLTNAVALLEQATGEALARAGLEAEDVDAIVSVSTSGIATPSLDALLMERLPFRRDVERLPIFGLGCVGGVLGFARAGALARAFPCRTVLLVVVELCGLTFRRCDLSKSNFIATALFGDGAASAIVRTEGPGPALTSWGEYTWPESLDIMGWDVVDDGFAVVFSRDIPALVRSRFRPVLDAFLRRHGLELDDVDHFLPHPGGAKVVDALEEALGRDRGALAEARTTLRDYGNMSAATVLFVLELALSAGARGRLLLSSLGPGFTTGFVMLDAG